MAFSADGREIEVAHYQERSFTIGATREPFSRDVRDAQYALYH